MFLEHTAATKCVTNGSGSDETLQERSVDGCVIFNTHNNKQGIFLQWSHKVIVWHYDGSNNIPWTYSSNKVLEQ